LSIQAVHVRRDGRRYPVTKEETMPEFMMLIIHDEQQRAAMPESEFAANFAKVGEWWARHESKGDLVPGVARRLQPTRTARTVRVEPGRSTVTDGPFAETKEAIGGFGIIEAPDIDAAVAIAKSWPAAPMTIEVRPVIEG
jgi:hypothetical protein